MVSNFCLPVYTFCPFLHLHVNVAARMQAQHCPALFATEAPQLLQRIHPLLSDTAPAVVDNACGAAARILQAHADRLPMVQVLPVLLQHLPIRKDWEEITPVAEALAFVVSSEHAKSVAEHNQALCKALLECALEQHATDEARSCAAQGLQALVNQDASVGKAVEQLSAEQQGQLQALMDRDKATD